jgi:hypothetical protein
MLAGVFLRRYRGKRTSKAVDSNRLDARFTPALAEYAVV